MSTVAQRSSNAISEMLDWLDSGAVPNLRSLGLTPFVRVEDFVEEGTYVLRAEMPGIDPDKDLALSIQDNLLTIRGERREEEKDKHRHEFHYGAFTRTVQLPSGVKPEDVTATYVDGILEVRIPGAAEKKEPVTVPVARES